MASFFFRAYTLGPLSPGWVISSSMARGLSGRLEMTLMGGM